MCDIAVYNSKEDELIRGYETVRKAVEAAVKLTDEGGEPCEVHEQGCGVIRKTSIVFRCRVDGEKIRGDYYDDYAKSQIPKKSELFDRNGVSPSVFKVGAVVAVVILILFAIASLSNMNAKKAVMFPVKQNDGNIRDPFKDN